MKADEGIFETIDPSEAENRQADLTLHISSKAVWVPERLGGAKKGAMAPPPEGEKMQWQPRSPADLYDVVRTNCSGRSRIFFVFHRCKGIAERGTFMWATPVTQQSKTKELTVRWEWTHLKSREEAVKGHGGDLHGGEEAVAALEQAMKARVDNYRAKEAAECAEREKKRMQRGERETKRMPWGAEANARRKEARVEAKKKATDDFLQKEAEDIAAAKEAFADEHEQMEEAEEAEEVEEAAEEEGADAMGRRAEGATSFDKDPDKALALYNELNGHGISWQAEKRPAFGADGAEWRAWEGAVVDDIERWVKIEDQTLEEIYDEARQQLSSESMLCACASCQQRSVELAFRKVPVRRMPRCFQLNFLERTNREALGTVELIDGVHARVEELPNEFTPTMCEVDLRELVTCYEFDGQWYHLDPDLVVMGRDPKRTGDDGGEGEDEPLATLCSACARAAERDDTEEEQVVAPQFSLAAGVDFGQLEKLGLPELSMVEKLLLSDVRPYGQVVKVAAPGNKNKEAWQHMKLKGHWIAFMHSGPQELAKHFTTLQERKDDLRRKLRIHLLGPEGSHDIMLKRLLASDEMTMRPTLVYNYFAIRNALREGLSSCSKWTGLDTEVQLPSVTELIEMLRDVTSTVAVRRSTDLSVEERADRPDDIANTRAIASDSKEGMADGFTEEGAEGSFTAHEENGTSGVARATAEHDEPAGGAGDFAVSHVGLMNTNSNSDLAMSSALHAACSVLKVERATNALNEFQGNGKHIMETFWYLFPLAKGLGSFEGTIKPSATKHLMQHKSNRFQRDAGFTLMLANQAQRHHALRGTNGAVKHSTWNEFVEVANDPKLLDNLQVAVEQPHSRVARMVMKTILPLIAISSRPVPWGAVERGSCISKLLAMIRRYGPASVFLTFAPNDVHDPLSIRLCVAHSTNEAFPAIPADFMEALRSKNEAFTCEVSGETFPMDEDALQRRAASNPASTSMFYQKVVKVVMEVLCGVPHSTPKSQPLGSRRKGMFGVGLADFLVTEETGRGAHHGHAALWAGATPSLCSGAAFGAETAKRLLQELERQFRTQVSLEVHVAATAQRTLYASRVHPCFVKAPSMFADASDEEEGGPVNDREFTAAFVRDADIVAAAVNNHSRDPHQPTCHKNKPDCGCRFGVPFAHPVSCSRCLYVTKVGMGDVPPFPPLADEEIACGANRFQAPMCDAKPHPVDVIASEQMRLVMGHAHSKEVHAHLEAQANPAGKPDQSQEVSLDEFGEANKDEGAKDPHDEADGDDHPRTQQGLRRLVPREECSNVVIETARPSLAWPTEEVAAQARGKAADKELKGSALLDAVKVMLAGAPASVHAEWERPEWVQVVERLRTATDSSLRALMIGWSKLKCANATITMYNQVLTAVLRCNTAPYLLGSRESSRAAMFYLVKYMTKDSVKLNATLSTLVDAKNHVDKWQSTADDAGGEFRNAIHFLQRATNSYMAEVHNSQAASLLLNYPASISSERFVYLASWDVVRFACEKRDVPPVPEVADVEIEGEEDEEDAETVEIGGETEWAHRSREEEYDGLDKPGASKTYTGANGEPVAVMMIEHYRLRGPELARFSPQEYFACVTIERKSADELKRRVEEAKGPEEYYIEALRVGRRPNTRVRCARPINDPPHERPRCACHE